MLASPDKMKTLLTAVLFCVTVATPSDTNKTVTGTAYDPTKFGGAQSYKELESGIIFYVESDGRHLAAIDREGKILWHRDPFADAKLEIYPKYSLTDNTRIVHVGKVTEEEREYFARKQRKMIRISFISSQFGAVDIKTGQFEFLGQD